MTEAYQRRMCDLLDSSARPFRSREPVVCLDEKGGDPLDMAEIGIAIRDRQRLDRHMPDRQVIAWQPRQNAARLRSERTFSRPDADARAARNHVS
jgi:hypothetical protein